MKSNKLKLVHDTLGFLGGFFNHDVCFTVTLTQEITVQRNDRKSSIVMTSMPMITINLSVHFRPQPYVCKYENVRSCIYTVFCCFYSGQCSHHVYARTGEEMELPCATLPWYDHSAD